MLLPQCMTQEANVNFNYIAFYCRLYGYEYKRIVGRRRLRYLIPQRRRIVRELRSLGWSYPKIGRAMNRGHSSIMHLARKV